MKQFAVQKYIQDLKKNKKINKKKKKKKNLAAEKSGGTTDRVTADQRYNGARCTEAWLYNGYLFYIFNCVFLKFRIRNYIWTDSSR